MADYDEEGYDDTNDVQEGGHYPHPSRHHSTSRRHHSSVSQQHGTGHEQPGEHADDYQQGGMRARKRSGSLRKRRASTTNASDLHDPTDVEIDQCEFNMSMEDLRDKNGPFSRMPKSFFLHNRQIARSALRKRDLCREYLRYGGSVSARAHKVLKHWTPRQKPSLEERLHDRLQDDVRLDHRGSQKEPMHYHASNSRTKANLQGTSSRKTHVAQAQAASRQGSRRKLSKSLDYDLDDQLQRMRLSHHGGHDTNDDHETEDDNQYY